MKKSVRRYVLLETRKRIDKWAYIKGYAYYGDQMERHQPPVGIGICDAQAF
jgi:hypothetical protein